MPNGSSPIADPSKTRWADAGKTPVRLPATDTNGSQNIIYDNGMRVYHPPGEIGPAILRPDGTVFNSGAACTIKGPSTDPDACVTYQPIAHTAIYDTKTGTWTAGPDLPGMQGAGDTWSSLLPNGNVLVQTNPPGITNDKLKRANARYASIRKATGHLAAEAAAPGFAPEAERPPARRPASGGSTSSTARASSPSRRGLCVTISLACCSCRPAR